MLTIIVFVLILGVLILAHELGHFLTARLFGVKAEEFGFGYPPRIFGWVKNDAGHWERVGRRAEAEKYKRTVWSLNWFPLGGFVKIKGEDANSLKEPDSFAAKKIWQRFIMLSAGVFMNFVLAFILLSVGFISGIPTMVDDQPPSNLQLSQAKVQIMSVMSDSPAQRADLKIGDTILSINNQPIKYVKDVQRDIKTSQVKPLELVIQRGDKKIIKKIIPIWSPSQKAPIIGVGLVKTAMLKYNWYEAIYHGALTTFNLTINILRAFWQIIINLIFQHKVATEVAGPIGIAVLTGQVVKLGWIYVLQFTALLSINLAIINLLPIPALDGGRILFLAIEKIKGSPVKQKLEAAIHQVGFILLMVLMLLVVFKDIHTYGARIWQSIVRLF